MTLLSAKFKSKTTPKENKNKSTYLHIYIHIYKQQTWEYSFNWPMLIIIKRCFVLSLCYKASVYLSFVFMRESFFCYYCSKGVSVCVFLYESLFIFAEYLEKKKKNCVKYNVLVVLCYCCYFFCSCGFMVHRIIKIPLLLFCFKNIENLFYSLGFF